MKFANLQKLTVKIFAFEKVIYNNNAVDMLVLPGLKGVLAVLPQHSHIIVVLKFGIAEVHNNGKIIDSFTISDGIAKVYPQGVDIITTFGMNCKQADKVKIEARIEEINAIILSKQNNLLQKEHKFLTANLELLAK
ncbi:ATP synthase, Delta/Epsilon chain, beta-sandwich domain protein [Orientia chuto str. Dubai]|uniref:ATP synthase epsilon chain n=1 Tax=Orientia chuto str. Dubai TaxID=1359168 RepID=A0A0F3MLM7_9RICK|nr:F0F1 ATP synthase subunit epsilon [Candidatus Orientia mediorientalis]KJV56663.1 ATP synthase, Delta/Epsilon chain, beta-sandwich domain protein [Orientia chuto str. Dubai]